MDFAIAGAAAVGACFFTNPLEVLKTRMQLQGELRSKGEHAIHYRNVVHAAYVVAKNDGALALQKGLVPALWVQLIMNGMRLGVTVKSSTVSQNFLQERFSSGKTVATLRIKAAI
jgi:solute carrier family 25 protein 34/35